MNRLERVAKLDHVLELSHVNLENAIVTHRSKSSMNRLSYEW